jgi:putative transposase
MNTQYPQEFHRRSLRLKGFDYSSSGAYFITVCTQNRIGLFGEIIRRAGSGISPGWADNQMELNEADHMITRVWNLLPEYYVQIDIDAFVVMPNHVHGIIIITTDNDIGCRLTQAGVSGQTQRFAPTSLPEVVKSFKSYTTRKHMDGVKNCDWKPFDGKLWQRNYYEHIIRDDDDLNRIREYIQYNPTNWEKDEEFI